jgi:uncharacterized membrane protein
VRAARRATEEATHGDDNDTWAHRGPDPGARGGTGNASDVNVGPSERVVCGVGGAALVAYGIDRGGWGGATLALLGGALAYRGVTGHCDVYEALGLTTAGKRRTEAGRDVHRGVLVRSSFTINRSPEECYQFWHNFENLPRFMKHVASVQKLDDRRWRWSVRAPMGRTVSWDAEVINDKPNELIAWRTIGRSDVDNAGSVQFRPAPANRGTEVTAEINYEPPAAAAGRSLAWLLGQSPDGKIEDDLRRFKQVMEAGEVATVEGQTTCRARG